MKKRISNFFIKKDIIVISLMLVSLALSFIYIGTPSGTNLNIIQFIITTISTIYLVIKKIKDKDNVIFNNWLDVFVTALCLSSLIPIIVGSYVSLYNSVLWFFRYVAVLNVYFLIKNLLKDHEKITDVIQNILIFGMLFLCIVGFDNLLTDTLTNFLHDTFKIFKSTNTLSRMYATFGYANAFAITCSVVLFLLMNQFLNKQSIVWKSIYIAISSIYVISIILTCSIGAIGIFAIMFIVYFILLKTKENRFAIFNLMLANGILGLIYIMFFSILSRMNDNIFTWIILVLFSATNVVFVYLLTYFTSKIKTIKPKVVILLIILFVVILVLVIVIGLQLDKPLYLFKNGESSQHFRIHAYDITPGETYTINIDLTSKIKEGENNDAYKIEIVEEDKYKVAINKYSMVFGNYDGTQSKTITLSDSASNIGIDFISINPKLQDGLTVTKLEINEKKYKLDYVYLPVALVNKVKYLITATFENKSVYERIEYMQTAIRLVKDYGLLGIGGNCWQNVYHNEQHYQYFSTQTHSYPFQILLEFGLLGILSYFGIITMLIIFILKRRKKLDIPTITILISLFTILLHAIFDFDMSFYLILTILFILLAFISSKVEGNFKKSKIEWIAIVILSCINIYALSFNVSNLDVQSNIEKKYDDKIVQAYLNTYAFDANIRRKQLNKLYDEFNTTNASMQQKADMYLQEYLKFVDTERYFEKSNFSIVALKLIYNKNFKFDKTTKDNILNSCLLYYKQEGENSKSLYVDLRIIYVMDLKLISETFEQHKNELGEQEKAIYNEFLELYNTHFSQIYELLTTNKNLKLSQDDIDSKMKYIKTRGILNKENSN